jgi:flagellar basal-body rod protein FlgB
MSWLADPSLRVLEGALDGLSRRESLIASNLANIDTPGYRPQSIDFESALRAELDRQEAGHGSNGLPASSGAAAPLAMRATDPRHLTGVDAVAGSLPGAQSFDGGLRNDGNTVDLESEMTALIDTQLRYGAVSELVTGKLGMLRTAIGGR